MTSANPHGAQKNTPLEQYLDKCSNFGTIPDHNDHETASADLQFCRDLLE